MHAAKRQIRSRSMLAAGANELTIAIRADGRHDHVTVTADRGFLYVNVDEEPVARLEPLAGHTYGLTFHHHSGRWEPTPFTGDFVRLANVLTTEFGVYFDSYDFPPTKSGPDH